MEFNFSVIFPPTWFLFTLCCCSTAHTLEHLFDVLNVQTFFRLCCRILSGPLQKMMDGVLVMWVLHREEADVEQAKLSRIEINLILVQIQM